MLQGRTRTAASHRAFVAIICAVASIFMTVWAAVLHPALAAAEDAATVKTVRVGWLENNEGYQTGTPGSYLSGWGYEYLQTLSYYTPGWKYEYVSGNFNDLMEKLEAGEIDLMSNISYSDEREEKLLYSTNPQGTERYYIYAKPSFDKLATGDPKELEGLTIGCNNGLMQTEVAQKWIANEGITCNYRYYTTGNEVFDALSTGEVDAIIMNDTISSEDAMPVFYVGETSYYLVVPKARQDLMDDINTAMTSISRANPRYNDEVKSSHSANNGGTAILTGAETAWLKAHGNTITVGYLDNKLPYSAAESDGSMTGSLSALIQVLHNQFGIDVNTKAFTSNTKLMRALKNGTIDVALPLYKDYWLAEQSDTVQSLTVATTSLVAIHRGDSTDSMLDTVAYHPASTMERNAIGVRFPQSKTLRCKDIDACVEAVKRGGATCMLVPVTRLETLRDKVDLGDLQTTELTNTIELTCRMRKGSPELLSIVNKAVVNSSDEIANGAYAHYSYAESDSDFMRFLYRNRTAITIAAITFLLCTVASLAWSLRRARAEKLKAEEANAAKTKFLSRMSHDIRTPLNGILGLLEIEELNPDDTELASENRAKARESANHLLTLINDILEMGKLEDGEVVLEHVPFNLIDICRDIDVLARVRAEERNITVTNDSGQGILYPDLIGSPTHARHILLNIVDNAIKYNKPGGSVTCTASVEWLKTGRIAYRFVVADTGIGMSPEFLRHIFEPFAQEKDDARSRYQGTGMGMPIVKALVEQMGGSIQVESEPGVGSTFTVVLPFTIDPHPEARRQKAEGPALETLEGLTILLAEDNDLNAEIAQTMLESQGALVVRAADGQEALDTFCVKPAGTFDVILMDIMMPNMNGYDAARAIRRSSKLDAATVAIIAMTANAFQEDVQAALDAGMNGHVSKPIDLEVLKAAIARHVSH